MSLKAPFPWFGGKSKAAPEVWAAIGDVGNYVEPFAGSLGVLLGRPPSSFRMTETVNDLDGYVVNFWRAVQADPDEVARHADWPVSEVDLTARHHWLVTSGRERLARMEADPDLFDAKVAGWWVWGLCSWIGSGWCAGTGPWVRDGDRLSNLPHLGNQGRGINRNLPHLGNQGQGINRKLPHLGNQGQGINRKLPHLGDQGQGINRKLPHLGNHGRGITEWMLALAERLRGVRVTCGDWSRVLSPSVIRPFGGGVTGVFLDPPYTTGSDLYATGDGAGVAEQVHAWARDHGDDPTLRIVVAGYDGEVDLPWRSISGRSGSGSTYASAKENRKRERLWLSPACLGSTGARADLFADVAS